MKVFQCPNCGAVDSIQGDATYLVKVRPSKNANPNWVRVFDIERISFQELQGRFFCADCGEEFETPFEIEIIDATEPEESSVTQKGG